MEKLYNPRVVRNLRDKYDFNMAKSLGQNFITDESVIDRIVESSGAGPTDLVIEIGPGFGVVTAGLAAVSGRVTAIEIDKKLIPILSETVGGYDNVKVINADVLEVDIKALIEQERQLPDGTMATGVKIVGNLPYYITTPILMKLFEDLVPADSITIMIQKEVAQRIAAPPGKKTYGNLSVAVQYYCDIVYVDTVPASVFVPRPKVDSAILRLDIRKERPVKLISEELFFECIKAGFGKRRKTLGNSLVGVNGADKATVDRALTAAGVDPVRRAETLTIEEFAAVANSMANGPKNQGMHL